MGLFDVVSQVAGNVVGSGISKLISGSDKVATTSAATTADSTSTSTDTSSSSFDTLLSSFLPADSTANVSEEELFSAAAAQRIQSLKGDEGLKAYQTALSAEKSSLAGPDGYVPMEKATLNSLKKLVTDGVLSKEEGNEVYTEAFNGSQLDSNTAALYDGKGGANDPTVAVAKMADAMAKLKTYIDQIAATPVATADYKDLSTADSTGATLALSNSTVLAGTGTASSSGNVVATGTKVDGDGGFLFKPVSNSSKSVAVMFGKEWTGSISGVKLLDSSGNVIESGKLNSAGISETGREKYSFSKSGGSYPDNVSVQVTFNDGAVKTYSIPDPSKRYD